MTANGRRTVPVMRRFAEAAERNKEPILAVLRGVLPAAGTVLEVASGTGQHVVHLAAALPDLRFQPSDPDADARASIAAWIDATGVPNVAPPLALDVQRTPWPIAGVDAIVAINMVHISPWSATQALIAGASERLPLGAPLCLYGPYVIDGATAPSNRAFDASLRARDPAWGVRELRDVQRLAAAHGLHLRAIHPMPANNVTAVFVRQRDASG